MTSSDNGEAEVSQYLDDERFNRTFLLPSTASRSTELKVTYADFGHQNDENVVLFSPPLMGSRYILSAKDKLAQKYGLRIISPDRPGFGGTTDVDPPDRVSVWLEIVEALLQHLSIKHVSILGYSAGTVYAMNMLLHLQRFLHPTRPYVAICAPWVHPSHSGVFTMKLVNNLPDTLLGSYDSIVRFFQSNVDPVLNFSSGLANVVPSLQGGSKSLAPGADVEEVAFEEKLGPELGRRITAESIQGLSKDVLLLSKYQEYWGSWGDYDKLVPLLAEREKELQANATEHIRPLKVDIFFAESDHMIGTADGPTWFNGCWIPEQRGDHIDYDSVVVPEANHDNILDLRYGVIERIFQEIVP